MSSQGETETGCQHFVTELCEKLGLDITETHTCTVLTERISSQRQKKIKMHRI
jgi:hypothetical protein